MGEGPKDLRDDAGRFDAPRNDDMVGRGEPESVGRGTTGAEPLTPATSAYPYGSTATSTGADAAVMSTARDNPNALDSTDTTPETAEIRAEIEQKRADISETIEEISQRLSPGNLASQATETVKETARDTMHRVTETATDTARRVADSASGAASQVADSSRRAGRTAVYQVREHPWSAGVLLAGLGAAGWWMMSRRSSGVEEWDVDDYTEESLYYDDDQFNVDRGNRFVNVVRDNPVPIALTTIGIGWWMWNQRSGSRRVTYGSGYPTASFDSTWDTRTGYGAAGAEAGTYRRFDSDRGVWVGGEEGEGTERTAERVKHAVSDASDRARETLSNATDRARGTMDDVTGRTREAASRAQRQIGQYSRQAKSQLQYWMEQNPLAVGAVAMALGAAVGLALPETRREQELMGDARDRMVDNAKSMANTAVDRATEAAQNLVGTAKGAADTTSSTANTAQDAISRASQAAKDTINKAE
jgi:ElaB/YqjD/DUF883 family membrane-anchored ribosome-binding protein